MCLWLKSKIAKISTLKVKRIAISLKFDPVNNSSLKVFDAGGGQSYDCLWNAKFRPTFLGCDSIQTKLPWHLEDLVSRFMKSNPALLS